MRKNLRACLVAVFLTSIPSIVSADPRLNFKLDTSRAVLPAFGHNFKLNWQGVEGEFEYDFKKDKLFGVISGFAFGVRKENKTIYEGTYLTARLLKSWKVNKSDVNFSVGAVYGLPGTKFNKTVQDIRDNEMLGYISIHPVRTRDVYKSGVGKIGILYSEPSVSFRQPLFWNISAEPVASLRLMRFGVIKTGSFGEDYQEKIVAVPSFGIRLTYKF